MKTHIKRLYKSDKPLTEDQKIVLEDIKVFKNKYNQWCLHFDTKNHKYLNVDYNTSTSVVGVTGNEDDIERLPYTAHGFSIDTGDYRDASYDFLTLYLIPESEEEAEELSGVAAILPTKWSYSCVIVKFEDFWEE